MQKVWKNLRAELCNGTRVKNKSREQISATNDIDNLENIIAV